MGSLTARLRAPRASVRTRILAAVVLPLALVSVLVLQVIADRHATVAATQELRARTEALVDLARLRDRVFEERRQHETLTRSAAVGLTPEAVESLLGMEVVVDPTAVRAATDAALAALEVSDRPFPPATLSALRRELDAAVLSPDEASARLDALEVFVVAGVESALDEVSERAVAVGDASLEGTVRVMRDAVRAVGSRGGQIRALSEYWFATGADVVPALAELAQATGQHDRLGAALASAPVPSVAETWSQVSPVGDIFDAAVRSVLDGKGQAVGGGTTGAAAVSSDLQQVEAARSPRRPWSTGSMPRPCASSTSTQPGPDRVVWPTQTGADGPWPLSVAGRRFRRLEQIWRAKRGSLRLQLVASPRGE